jgi:cell wall-associated NlpC family hydrolase
MGLERAIALIMIASLLVLSLSGIARASTPAIDKATRQAEALRELIEQLDEELGAAAEDYNYAKQQLDDTQAAIKKTSKQLAKSEADLGTVQARLNERVVEIYKTGDITLLAVVLGANSFSELIDRFDQLRRLSRQDAELLEQVQDYKTDVADRKRELEVELKQEKAGLAQTEAAKQKVLAQLEKQKKALKGKEAQIAQLKKEEAARQAALAAAAKKAAEEAARKAVAARAAAKAAAAKAKAKTTATTEPSNGKVTANPDGVSGAEVVAIAMKYLGVPYVWGGQSASGLDCSGLVKFVYGKVGIYLPHSSRMQYGYGVYVSQSELRAGDLVFFYNPIHHVGIYIGDGKMIHASGGGVQIGIAIKKSYYGARRILN